MGRLSPRSLFVHPSAWRLEPEPSTFAPSGAWSNKDMDPVPLNMRTWTTFNYITYWISDAANAATWALASSMLAVGLSWYGFLYPAPWLQPDAKKKTSRRQALTAIALGNVIIGTVMVLNGTIGARLHIPFPVLNRSSFGFWFSYFSVISRVVLALFWFGVQTTIGAECVYQARHRSFSHSRISHGHHPRC
jgi:NCS1 family nucleobase:cation symporter-1